MVQDYTWEENSDEKIRIYTCVLHLLSAMSQETYLYHVDKGSQVPPPDCTVFELLSSKCAVFIFSCVYPP